ncbi:hypothetical protein CLAFUW4_05889 [Fulvia fulva]|uniref:Uncharacterized protein n=1 Tax=Passalora fulva TaxID=5499 RepID=A0A9Q8P8T2_PASFU|nr:uncharacterized protein CLAFUR5_06033 [Fulvia fulva]KAK4623562.1 hypothetical protein CLAFUR4_05883 [Fulvia fulva]KAK4624942.1 hypothetical protein CLAFUR0_05896 [Fulvia fulva]UJO17443.1 hypothetical protein CLAFUR5_06033 [Fulvia fulva]WPV14970.1 hypothetical protein CLAFUW4_05889 [Fulvia fulva]WPV30199.1 hypothetical protein CLAFUW7_05887 [Fulvia fulva]
MQGGADQNVTAPVNSAGLVGWQVESSGRGTLKLIASCLATTALCTWIVIHSRIYKRKKHRLPHKAALWLKTIVAPEFIAVEAAQEWTQARRVMEKCSKLTGGQFQMVHSLYIGMFGLRYRTSCGTRVLWPNQFIWLLEEGLLDWQRHVEWGMSRECTKDKGNADTTANVLTLAQVSWFVAQSIMRRAHNLPLAPLESMTSSYIPLFAVAYAYWWIKPKDIETPSEIDLPQMSDNQAAVFESLAVDGRFDDEATAEQQSLWGIWALTPRTFEKEADLRASEEEEKQYQHKQDHFEKHVEKCSVSDCRAPDHKVPSFPKLIKKLKLSHWDPDLYHSRLLWPVCCLAGISFPALHLISWNSVFPTLVETWLWRASAIASLVGMLIFMQFDVVVVSWKDPLMLVKVLSPAVYFVTRIILLAGAFAALRASDPAIYETYVVSTYWVHVI